ncbi:MAG: MFS transporter [Clostridiales bacterium]|nr:MFS transporter [Clostridiales bacterium]
MLNINDQAGSQRLSARIKAGYAVGQATDSIGFNVFYFFFLFFLTDVAGIPAGVAGTISLIAVAWDAVTDPVVGHISDNLTSKYGRRRPMMIGAIVPYCVCMFLLFTNIDMSNPGAKFAYFCIIAVLFWTGYKIFVIPFFALGAELTGDFNERTTLRVWASVVMYGAVMLASAAPLLIVDKTVQAGGSDSQGWSNVGLIFAVLIAITLLVCWRATRGRELVSRDTYHVEKGALKGNFFKSFGGNVAEIFRIKAARFLVGSVLAWAIVSSMVSGGLVYLMDSNLGYSPEQQSLCYVIMALAAIFWLPFINKGAEKLDKRRVYFTAMLMSGIGLAIFALLNFPFMWVLIVFLFVFNWGNSTFWTLYYSMMYDISELDEFVTGKRREGTIAALMSFAQKLGAAIALWLTGQILEFGGYNGALAVQSAEAGQAILAVNTWIPGIIGIVAAVFAFGYPLTRDRFSALMAALEAKRKGEPYSTRGFEKLL